MKGVAKGEDILKEGVCQTLVFVLFEPEKLNKHKQKQCGGRCPWRKRGYLCCLFLVRVISGPKEWSSSKRYPAFFLYVARKVEMLHSGFGYLTER